MWGKIFAKLNMWIIKTVINQNSEQTHPSPLPFMLSRVVVRSILPQILADWNQQRHHQHFDGSSNEHLSQLPSSDYLLRSSGVDQSGGQANRCSRWGCGSTTNTNIIQCLSSVHEVTEKLLLDIERFLWKNDHSSRGRRVIWCLSDWRLNFR